MDWRKAASSPLLWGFIGLIAGGAAIWRPMLDGASQFSAMFQFILTTIGFAFAARSMVGWLPFFGILLVGMAALTGMGLRDKRFAQYYSCFTAFVTGWSLARGLIFFLLDEKFFDGAVVTLPFILGTFILAGLVGGVTVNPPRFKEEFRKPSVIAHSFYLGGVLVVALLLTLPNLAAVAGLEPSPPDRASTGYGSGYAPYEVVEFSYTQQFEENFTVMFDEWAMAQEWKVHVFVPVGIETHHVGIAIFLHGYQGEKIEFYRDTLESLAGQGLVAIFPQYVSALDLSTVPQDFSLTYEEGGSNHPQHQTRYDMALRGVDSAFDFIGSDSNFSEVLNPELINIGHLWIGGHSMGAGTTFHVLSTLLEWGVGGFSLVVDLEAPWVTATQPGLRGNMSQLPDHALVHVVEYETELVVEKCLGRWQYDRLNGRDGSTILPAGQALFLQIPSDRRGFPRLVASHYLPAAIIRESLADQSYYPRIEAQADYVASSAMGDEAGADAAKAWFMEEGEMTDLGEWSDRVSVKPIRIVNAPLEIDDGELEACPTA